jgi:NADPH:quinone reductase-like Zn-dependent oxidoreductase
MPAVPGAKDVRPEPWRKLFFLCGIASSVLSALMIIVPRYGGPDVMTVVEEPRPEPGSGEVRVRTLVAGVGYPDVLIREGTYPGGPKPPFTPGYEFIGIVDKLGAGVEGSHRFDR